jgi:hypothetical protein
MIIQKPVDRLSNTEQVLIAKRAKKSREGREERQLQRAHSFALPGGMPGFLGFLARMNRS